MFYEYEDSLPIFQRLVPTCTREQMYALAAGTSDPIGHSHMAWERTWHASGRPFYRVWPKVLPLLTRLDISAVSASSCKLPAGLGALLVQLPVGNDLGIRYVLCANMPTSQGGGMFIGTNHGERIQVTASVDVPAIDAWLFPHGDAPLVETLESLNRVSELSSTAATRNLIVSLVTTLCLLDSDPELISPVLLSKDQGKAVTQADIDRLAAKARRRGRYGWDVGREVEVMPHYRRPHTALVWTGQGRKIPRVVLRKGSLVHRAKVEHIPTGYMGADNVTTEQNPTVPGRSPKPR